MMSEWLVDLPANFEENWTMVVSPIGKRCLIIASRVSEIYMFLVAVLSVEDQNKSANGGGNIHIFLFCLTFEISC